MEDKAKLDVLIIGRSYAGLSAALALGRSLRNTLIIDSGMPCNRQTPHSHNFLTQDGKTPEAIATLARQQVEQYETVRFHPGRAIRGEKTSEGFKIETQAGDTFIAKKLIFATGIKDQIPAIPGFAACWGISVIHCPYCHGYEYKNQPTGILANGEAAMHYASLVNNLTPNLTIFTKGPSTFTGEQLRQLDRHNIPVVETEVVAFEHREGYIDRVVLQDHASVPIQALYASIPFVQHSDIPASLGCTLTEEGRIETDSFQQTTVPGVFACGDNASKMRSVAGAVASGNLAGAMANSKLTGEQF